MPYSTAFPAESGWYSIELWVEDTHTGELTKFSDWIGRWGGTDPQPLAKPAKVVIHHFPIVGWAWEEESMEALPVFEQPDVDEDGRIAPGGAVRLIRVGPFQEHYESVEALSKAFGSEVEGMWTKYEMAKG